MAAVGLHPAFLNGEICDRKKHKMRSAPGIWYTGGYYEKNYLFV